MKKFLFLIYICLFGLIQNSFAYDYELGIACIFKDSTAILKEWIEYHRMVGVDHFWLYNNYNTDNSIEILKPYIEEGLVELCNWPPIEEFEKQKNKQKFRVHNHETANINAIKRALGKAKWVAFIDIDEFLLPMKEATVTECLEKHFSKAYAVYIHWRNFGTSGMTLSKEESWISNLTKASSRFHSYNLYGKTIVRPEYISLNSPHISSNVHIFPIIKKENYFNGNAKKLTIENPYSVKYIRINHYILGDENYFHNIRLKREQDHKKEWQHYHDFLMKQNYDIIKFIYKYHRDKYEKFWKKLEHNKFLKRN